MAKYLWTYAGLLALTTLTLLLSFAPLGGWEPIAAMSIAFLKAVLVILWFMHLIEQRSTNWIAFTVSLLLLACLIGFTSLDVGSRVRLVPPELGRSGGTAVRAPLDAAR